MVHSSYCSDTGDNLHFGLARLMAHSAGNQNVELVVVGDDVSVPHSRGKMVGRRCLAGITLGQSSSKCFRNTNKDPNADMIQSARFSERDQSEIWALTSLFDSAEPRQPTWPRSVRHWITVTFPVDRAIGKSPRGGWRLDLVYTTRL